MATDDLTLGAEAVPPEAYAAALASLPDVHPSTLTSLLCGFDAVALWQGLVEGDRHVIAHARAALQGNRVDDFLDEARPKVSERVGTVVARWQDALRAVAPSEIWRRYCDAGIGVATLNSAGYPAALAGDLAPPSVLFHKGTIDVVAGPRVGMVGTRTCTRYGRDVAFDLAQQLSKAGVAIVSGLATGIDAAAHAGALHGPGPPIAVVGSGLDVVYPHANRRLWTDVEERGVVLSESPLGAAPQGWRFPARNRIIAALSDVLIVVESHDSGGSLITARQQAKRGQTDVGGPRADPVAGVQGLQPVAARRLHAAHRYRRRLHGPRPVGSAAAFGARIPSCTRRAGAGGARCDRLAARDLRPVGAPRRVVPGPVGRRTRRSRAGAMARTTGLLVRASQP